TQGYADEKPVQNIQCDGFFMMDHKLTIQDFMSIKETLQLTFDRDPVAETLRELDAENETEVEQLPIRLTFYEANYLIGALNAKFPKSHFNFPSEVQW